jgi:hypothetical protein
VQVPEHLWYLGALQVNEAIECYYPDERSWWKVQGTHIPFVEGNVRIPLGCMLDHSRREINATNLQPSVFEIPCHMPRSTAQVAHHTPPLDTLRKGIQQVSVKGFAGEFLEECLRILLGDLVIAGFDGPGGRGHRENSHVLCRSNQQPLIKPKQLIMLRNNLVEKMQSIRLLPPGIPEVQQCQFSHPCYVLWGLVASIDDLWHKILGEEAMDEIGDTILHTDEHIILTWQEIVHPFQ